LISDAWAQSAPNAPGATDLLFGPGFLIVMLVVFFFAVIWPQSKRAKEHKKMVESLQKGDEVVVAGGIVGRIAKVKDKDNYVTVQVANSVEIQVQRDSLQVVLPKGTIKNIE
jgi:preprotein translocase subunit YajC